MNILTFDIEEWYIEKAFRGGRASKYKQFDEAFNRVIDLLAEHGIRATFFCVGQLAVEFPDIVKRVVAEGHEVGCHSNVHTWVDKMDEKGFRNDTLNALKALEDVSGKKVNSYRAPAFSITPNNKWAVEVLAECGIENDASIFPTCRDFGGYKGFPQDTPCIIEHNGLSLKEYPVCLTTVLGKAIAFSGGGYFRILPYWKVSRTIKNRDYNIFYFHLADLITEKRTMMSKTEYEEYFMEPGTIKNRVMRYIKSNVGKGDAFVRLKMLLNESRFVCIQEADSMVCWDSVKTIIL